MMIKFYTKSILSYDKSKRRRAIFSVIFFVKKRSEIFSPGGCVKVFWSIRNYRWISLSLFSYTSSSFQSIIQNKHLWIDKHIRIKVDWETYTYIHISVNMFFNNDHFSRSLTIIIIILIVSSKVQIINGDKYDLKTEYIS